MEQIYMTWLRSLLILSAIIPKSEWILYVIAVFNSLFTYFQFPNHYSKCIKASYSIERGISNTLAALYHTQLPEGQLSSTPHLYKRNRYLKEGMSMLSRILIAYFEVLWKRVTENKRRAENWQRTRYWQWIFRRWMIRLIFKRGFGI